MLNMGNVSAIKPSNLQGWARGWLPPLHKHLSAPTSAPEVFCSSLFIPRTRFEKSLVMVSYYGYEIRRHK